jgi:hypothetical protein
VKVELATKFAEFADSILIEVIVDVVDHKPAVKATNATVALFSFTASVE